MKRFISCLLLFAAYIPAVLADHVDPLLDGWVRHQEAPFNNYCPYYFDENGKQSTNRSVVGCVATALESIISYHRQPVVLQDVLPAWSSKNFTTTDIPAGTTIDTRLILENYGDGTAASVGMNEEDYAVAVDAVAQLSLMCGMAAQMSWNTSASGADASTLVEPMQNIFGWKTAIYLDSYDYTPAQWREVLKNELRNGRPVLYTGYTMNIAGHAFVIDGFDENDHFHVNWGYGGEYDGHYYDITELCAFANPDDTTPQDVQQGFFCNQQALILSPDEIDHTVLADSLERTGQEIQIEDIRFDDTALTNKYTPVTITLHNTADVPLCSPFEIFSNAMGDKDLFKEGDYGALFGVNMEPGERRTMTIHCKFTQKGYRTVHISPDDVTVLGDKKLTFTVGSSDNLVFSPVSIEFTNEGTEADPDISATFTVPVKNNAYERAGSLITYCLFNDADRSVGDWRHFDYCYLATGAQTENTVTYKHLQPGDAHTFAVRWPWPIRQEYKFVVPAGSVVGCESLLAYPTEPTDDNYYDLSGRRSSLPTSGILIHGGKKVLR